MRSKYSIDFRRLKFDLQLLHLDSMSSFTLDDLENSKNHMISTNPNLKDSILTAYEELKEFYLYTRGSEIGKKIENKNQLRIIDMAQSILNSTTLSFADHKEIDDTVENIRNVLQAAINKVNLNPTKLFTEEEANIFANNYEIVVRDFITVYLKALDEKNNYRYHDLILNVHGKINSEIIFDNPLDDLVYVINEMIVEEGKKASRAR